MDPQVQSALIAAAATLIGVGGTVTVAIAAARNARRTNQATIDAARADAQLTLAAARETQFADRYSRALEQVGSANLNVRIGGIYALEGIALDSPAHHPTVMEVLTAFIREHSRASADGAKPAQWPLPDVQAALAVVRRRKAEHDIRVIDLTGADLSGASLTGANLTDANLARADLTGANLAKADLAGANLTAADLTGANLMGSDLAGAYLAGAILTAANVSSAGLLGADLTDADLAAADLARANLTGARLPRATLTRATLIGANLAEAVLTEADLTGTDLRAAMLIATDLTRAKLTRATLTGQDFTATTLTGATFADTNLTSVRWPEGARVPGGWMVDSDSGRLKPAGQLSEVMPHYF